MWFSIFLIGLNAAIASAPQTSNTKLPSLQLAGDLGGRIDGSPWSTSSLEGKVWAIFYVDPDEKEANAEMENAIKQEKFSREHFGSVAIINMDATWLPNKVIESSLAKKQEQFPNVVYVRDLKKVLVKEWRLSDDSYEVLVINRKGQIVWQKAAPFVPEDTKQVIELIKLSIDEKI